MENYLSLNQTLWDARTTAHVASAFYDVQGFLNGDESLKAPELALLGDVTGKKILHLQCHFGQDTLSLARKGAIVTGMDFSPVAIAKAQELAHHMQLPAEFICCDVYDLPQHLNAQFDIVFTSYGVIGWLPNIEKWAKVVAHFMKPGGKFIFAEFHPVVWMFDNDFQAVTYPYHKTEPIVEEEGTYTDGEMSQKHTSVGWNHGLAEVIQSLLNEGIILTHFQEYDFSPFDCFAHTEKGEDGNYRITHLAGKVPMMYTIAGTKPE